MQKAAIRIILLLIVAVRAIGQTLPEPRLISAGLPKYPAIARQARIQGEVHVEFTLNSNGEPVTQTGICLGRKDKNWFYTQLDGDS